MMTDPLDDRRRAMVEANLGLAWMHARRQRESAGFDQDDAAQEAAIGLMVATGKFDERRGLKFTTYASWWCRQRIQRARYDPGVIHVPEWNRKYEGKSYVADVERARAVVSMSEPLPGEGMRATVGDTIAAPEPEESEFADEAESLGGRLEGLDDRHREVLRRRYWLDQSLAEVGLALGVSKQRASQLEAEAIDRLREGYGLMPHATARAIAARRKWTIMRRGLAPTRDEAGRYTGEYGPREAEGS